MQFVLASHNQKKLAEMATILDELGVEVLPLPKNAPEPEENGATFEENALIKAQSASDFTGLPAIADDSGLCVEALDGRPGVHSARYGPPGATDAEKYTLLLKELRGKENRRARFVSSICCTFPNGDVLTAEGVCEGEILPAPRGSDGFGYDPVFLVSGLGRSMAELTPEEKNAVSHRGNALRLFRQRLEEYLAANGE